MLVFIDKIDNCSNFAVNLDKIKIRYDQSFGYSKQKNHRNDER